MSSFVRAQDAMLASHFGASDAAIRQFRSQPVHVEITAEVEHNRTYALAYAFCINLLSRTFPRHLTFNRDTEHPLRLLPFSDAVQVGTRPENATTVVFGSSAPGADVYATCHDWKICLDGSRKADPDEQWNPVLALALACYAAARVTYVAARGMITGGEMTGEFSILDFRGGTVEYDWDKPVDIGVAHLAGVGAIGSGFLAALGAHATVAGRLVLVDHDPLEVGNLDRYCFFDSDDVDSPKALSAAARLHSMAELLDIVPAESRLQDYFKAQYAAGNRFGLEKLISAPDRRSTRRSFQELLPGRVWDASTSPDELIVHHNNFDPTQACLFCIYPPSIREDAQHAHIAEQLGVAVDRVKSNELITAEEKDRIRIVYPALNSVRLQGRPYESVFKDLCSASALRVHPDAEAVLTPFAFISALAGILLYLEFIKSVRADVFGDFLHHNYYRLNPFFRPNPFMREMRRATPGCPCCQAAHNRRVYEKLWGTH
jgi:hypothetical protein